LLTVARNLAIDLLRKRKREIETINDNYKISNDKKILLEDSTQELSEDEFEDSQLTLFFICCNPAIPEESQIALILKIFCGFSTAEIARAICTNEVTIQKRIYRARKTLQELNLKFEMPSSAELHVRLPVVHHVLYLIFNEGYHSGKIDLPIRDELVEDAMRLCWQICENTKIATADTYALMALFCFHASRLYGRIDNDGILLDFKHQDRTKWNNELIQQGKKLLYRSAKMNTPGIYFAEAAISCEYSIAKRYQETNWSNIIRWYDKLISLHPSSAYLLQRAIASGELHGVSNGIKELKKIENDEIAKVPAFHLAIAKWLSDLNQTDEAILAYEKALTLTHLAIEKAYIKNKIGQIKKGSPINGLPT
jgi:RNA polymerase sigma-70 factor (ECF subfamily)